MDEIVIRGMARWPNVPAVYGWLALDRRGEWLLKGERISNPAMTGFIGRNYEHDGRGRWFFQNGPQRVYVALEYTPFVYRAARAPDGRLEFRSHNGRRAEAAKSAWLDDHGNVLIETDLGIGVVHDRDLDVIVSELADGNGMGLDEEALEARMSSLKPGTETGLYLRGLQTRLPLRVIAARDVARRFGFDPNPVDDAARIASRGA